MAGAAVEFLIEKLKEVLIHDGAVTHRCFSAEVKKLDNHLRRFKALPKRSSDGDEQIRRLRDAVYDAEDKIDAYVTQKNSVNIVRTTVDEIEAVLENIRCIYTENSTPDSDDSDDYYQHQRIGEDEVRLQNVVVGIEDEMEVLSTQLIQESTDLQVLSIVGMAGMGKTILAHKIFDDARIVSHFPIRIWVYVSKTFTQKEIFLHILKDFTLLTDDIMTKTDQELADLVACFLENERFLLVMDDLWSPVDWDKLKVALPMSNQMGRVLITSRSMEVGTYVNSSIGPHRMRPLNDDESFELLQLEALRGHKIPPELELEGRQIARGCDGLPLAIVLIGGILVKEFFSEMHTQKAVWTKVSKSLTSIMHDHKMERMPRIIAMSYEKLPYDLRECFLYFGMFPEDFEISVWKLIRLWIAEGFIHKSDFSLEETAENYLRELIDRNLVKGVKFKLNGLVACTT